MSAPEPEKFIKTAAGTRRINPAWKAWKEAGGNPSATTTSSPPPPAPSGSNTGSYGSTTSQEPVSTAAPTAPAINPAFFTPAAPAARNYATALPVVSSIAEQKKYLGDDVQVAENYTAAQHRYNTDVMAQQIGLPVDQLQMGLDGIFGKFEIPMGLLDKLLEIQNYQVIEYIVDDSGSMQSRTNARSKTGQPLTRWTECLERIEMMIELMAFLPFNQFFIRFLNRSTVIEIIRRPRESPTDFIRRIHDRLRQEWSKSPGGRTPVRERLQESLARYSGLKCIRGLFCDGCPNGGDADVAAITKMMKNRRSPQDNPFTFFSCSERDEDVEWMKEAEEAAPFCGEIDDFKAESEEVLKDQGASFPFGFGFYLVASLVGAMNPYDLDALDESAPMTKATLRSLLGYDLNDAEYDSYFNDFLRAQKSRRIESRMDRIKVSYANTWEKHRDEFKRAPRNIDVPCVKSYQSEIRDAEKTVSCPCVIQ